MSEGLLEHVAVKAEEALAEIKKTEESLDILLLCFGIERIGGMPVKTDQVQQNPCWLLLMQDYMYEIKTRTQKMREALDKIVGRDKA